MKDKDDARLEVLLNGVRGSKDTIRQGKRMVRLGWLHTDRELQLIEAACKQRNISRAAFARRAVMSFTAYVLGIPYEVACDDMPRARTYFDRTYVNTFGQEVSRREKPNGSLKGEGFGEWRIKQLY